jgi:hypothetical protein
VGLSQKFYDVDDQKFHDDDDDIKLSNIFNEYCIFLKQFFFTVLRTKIKAPWAYV